MTKKFQLTRRRALGGMATIGAASAVAGAGTMALFSDTETDNDNTVQAGTLDLLLGGGGSTHLSMSNVAPGELIGPEAITLQNDGTLAADHVEATASGITDNDPSDSGTTEFGPGDVSGSGYAQNLWITSIALGGASGPLFKQIPGLSLHDTDAGVGTNARANTGSEEITATRQTIDGRSAVYVTSEGTQTRDYSRSLRDVSSEGVSLGDLAGGGDSALSYAWWGGSGNENALPDEVFIVVENDTGRHVAFKNAGSSNTPDTSETWTRRTVANELNDGSNVWREYHPDVSDGSGQTTSITDPVTAFGSDAMLQLVGFGYGYPSSSGGVGLEAAFSDLIVNGTTYDFRTSRISIQDLAQSSIDNMKGIGPGSSRNFQLGLRLNPSVGNAFQEEGIDFDLEFTLNQDASQ